MFSHLEITSKIIAFALFHSVSWIDRIHHLGEDFGFKIFCCLFSSKSISLKMCPRWMQFCAINDGLHSFQLFVTVKCKVVIIKGTCIRLCIVSFKLWTDFSYLDFTAWPEIGSLIVMHFSVIFFYQRMWLTC